MKQQQCGGAREGEWAGEESGRADQRHVFWWQQRINISKISFATGWFPVYWLLKKENLPDA